MFAKLAHFGSLLVGGLLLGAAFLDVASGWFSSAFVNTAIGFFFLYGGFPAVLGDK